MKGGAIFLAIAAVAVSTTPSAGQADQTLPSSNVSPVSMQTDHTSPNSIVPSSTRTPAGLATLGAIVPAVKVQADVVYDSNVAASTPALATLRGLTRADEIFTPNLDVSYIKQLGAGSFNLVGQAGYDFYRTNTILNRERLNAQSSYVARVDDCQATIQGTYARAQSDLQDLSVLTTKNTEEDISAGLNGVCNQSGRLVPTFSVTQAWSTNTAPFLLTSDSRSIATQGGILYRHTPLGDITLLGQYTDTQFSHRLVLKGGRFQEDGYKLYAGGLQLERHFDSYLDVFVSVFEDSLKSDSGIGPKFEGLTYDSSLIYHFDTRLQTKLEFSRKTSPSNRLDASYSLAEAYQAEVDYQITRRLLATLGASDTRSTLNGAALVPGVDVAKESVKAFFATLRFDINPGLSVNLTANQDQRHADVIGYTYASTRFGLSISQAF